MFGNRNILHKRLVLAAVCLALSPASSQTVFCRIKEVFAGTCDVQCSGIGVNGDSQHPGHVTAQFLADKYPEFKDICTDAWVVEISESAFPNNRVDRNWLVATGELPPISSLILERCSDLSDIEAGAFNTSSALGKNLFDLAFYYNKKLLEIKGGLTDGLETLRSFSWVGNGRLQRADSEILVPLFNTIEVIHIGDCGMSSPEILANLTGYCQIIGSFPRLFTMDLGFNPGPGLNVLSSRHLNKLDRVRSLYLWNSEIRRFEDTTVFDDIAKSITTIDLSNNLLTTLRNGTLDSIIAENKVRVLLGLAGNPWHCDCHLEWLQTVLRFALGGVIASDTPKCATPPLQADKPLIEADMRAECEPQFPDDPFEIICTR